MPFVVPLEKSNNNNKTRGQKTFRSFLSTANLLLFIQCYCCCDFFLHQLGVAHIFKHSAVFPALPTLFNLKFETYFPVVVFFSPFEWKILFLAHLLQFCSFCRDVTLLLLFLLLLAFHSHLYLALKNTITKNFTLHSRTV